MGPTLVAYIGLFRPAKQDLSNSRAYALAQETLELTTNHPLLAEAMRETVHSIHAKRHQGENKPMANHNYLKRVLEAKAQTAVVNQSPNIEVKQQHQLSEAEDRRLFEQRMQQLGGRVMTKVNP
jgi:ribosomal protein S30